MKRILAILFLTCLPGIVQAGDYVLSESTGFWIRNGNAYTRESYTDHYHKCGQCYKKTRYRYHFHHKIQQPVAKIQKKKDWRSVLLEIAEQKQEDRSFVTWAEAIGINPYDPQVQSRLQANGYNIDARFSSRYTPIADQGRTSYGYNAYASQSPAVDLMTLNNQVYQITSQAQSMASQAASDQASLVAQHNEIYGEAERIKARGEETSKLLKVITELLRDRPEIRENEAELLIRPNQPAQPQPQNPNQPGAVPVPPEPESLSQAEQQQLVQLVENRCLRCHDGSADDTTVVLTDYLSLPKREKLAAIQAVQGAGPSGKVMPPEGEPLTENEMLLMVRDYLTSK